MSNLAYPTAATTTVYMNGLHVEQVYRVDWKENDPRIPIYGYNDRIFSKVISGRKLIQGFLVLNFIYSGYLTDVLQIQVALGAGSTARSLGIKLRGADRVDEAMEDKLRAELGEISSQANSREAKARYIMDLLASKNTSREDRERIKRALKKSTLPKPRADFDISEAKLPLDNQAGVSLDVYYQDPDTAAWNLSFRDVYFTNVSQQISIAGAEGSSEPLYEVYEWIASERRVILNV